MSTPSATVMLTSHTDIRWLLDGHLKGCNVAPFAVAELKGNEDCPDSIVLYERDHYQSAFVVYTTDDNGTFTLQGAN